MTDLGGQRSGPIESDVGKITIDDKFARFGSKSYAINKINSVDVRKKVVHGETLHWFLWGGAAVILLLCLGPFRDGLIICLIVAGVMALFGYFSWERREEQRFYSLFLTTSSAENQAFISQNREDVHRLRDEIEEAISRSS
jgi:hypothetical protein